MGKFTSSTELIKPNYLVVSSVVRPTQVVQWFFSSVRGKGKGLLLDMELLLILMTSEITKLKSHEFYALCNM